MNAPRARTSLLRPQRSPSRTRSGTQRIPRDPVERRPAELAMPAKGPISPAVSRHCLDHPYHFRIRFAKPAMQGTKDRAIDASSVAWQIIATTGCARRPSIYTTRQTTLSSPAPELLLPSPVSSRPRCPSLQGLKLPLRTFSPWHNRPTTITTNQPLLDMARLLRQEP